MLMEQPRAQPDYDLMDDMGDFAESHPAINVKLRQQPTDEDTRENPEQIILQ